VDVKRYGKLMLDAVAVLSKKAPPIVKQIALPLLGKRVEFGVNLELA